MGQQPFGTALALPYSGVSIALVDDDALLRNALSRLLEMTGMRVETYASGQEFLAAAGSSQAHCVVLDVQLGDLSGIAVAQELRSSEPHFPIVFITGSIDHVFEQQADEIVGASFLRKPFLRDTLIDAVMAAITNRDKLDAASAARGSVDASDRADEE